MQSKNEEDVLLREAEQCLQNLKNNELTRMNKGSVGFFERKKEILKRMGVVLVEIKQSGAIVGLCDPRVVQFLKLSLLEFQCRAPCLTILRIFLQADSLVTSTHFVASLYLEHNIPLYIVRVLDRDDSRKAHDPEDDISQSLHLVKTWIECFAAQFPRLLGSSLIALAEMPALHAYEGRKANHLSAKNKLLAVETVLALAEHHPRLCFLVGGFTFLSQSCCDPAVESLVSRILTLLLSLLCQGDTRKNYATAINLECAMAAFAEPESIAVEQGSTYDQREKLRIARTVIGNILKSWTGLIILANKRNSLSCFIEIVRFIPPSQHSEVRIAFFDVINDLLCLAKRNGWHETRINSLIHVYVVMLLKLLIKCGLMKTLAQISCVEEVNVAEPAQLLLRKLCLAVSDFPEGAKELNFLLAGKKNRDSVLEHALTLLMSKMGTFVYEVEPRDESCVCVRIATFFPNSCENALNELRKTLNYVEWSNVSLRCKKLLDKEPILKEDRNNYKKWNWDILLEFVSCPPNVGLLETENSEKQRKSKLFKQLLRFYSFSRGSFCEQKWSISNMIYLRVGFLLVRTLITDLELIELVKVAVETSFDRTFSLIAEKENALKVALEKSETSFRGFYIPFFKCFEREYTLWLTIFTESENGYAELCSNNFFEQLFVFLPLPRAAFVIAAVMNRFDYSRDNMLKKTISEVNGVLVGPRALLIQAVELGSIPLLIYCAYFLRRLILSLSSFRKEWLGLLLKLIEHENHEVCAAANKSLESIIETGSVWRHFLEKLLDIQAKEDDKFRRLLGLFSERLTLLLLSDAETFNLLTRIIPNLLNTLYEQWVCQDKSLIYFSELEVALGEKLKFMQEAEEIAYSVDASAKEMEFVCGLPWLMLVNEEELPVWAFIDGAHLQFSWQALCPAENLVAENISLSLSLGSMSLSAALFLVEDNSFAIHLPLDEHEHTVWNGRKTFLVRCKGINIYFSEGYQVWRIEVKVKLKKEESSELECHLFASLVQHTAGREFLEQKDCWEKAKEIIRKVDGNNPILIRGVLWSIAHYGSREEGIAFLLKENLIAPIIDLTLRSHILSLRGTGLYVLNFFSRNQMGRNLLEGYGFDLKQNNQLCLPNDEFYIFEEESCSMEGWEKYAAGERVVSSDAKVFQEQISQGMSVWGAKNASTKVKEMIKNYPKITHCFDLLHNILNLLSYFKIRHECRSNILNLFDEFILSNEFYKDGLRKISYVLEPVEKKN